MKSDTLMYPPESPYYEGPRGGTLTSGGVPMQNLLVVNGQIENDRAYIAGRAMENLSILADIERQYAECNPASAGYYSAIMEAYTMASQETIMNYGRNICSAKKKWR